MELVLCDIKSILCVAGTSTTRTCSSVCVATATALQTITCPTSRNINFHALEVVGRGSETQLQVGKNLLNTQFP